MGKIIGYYRLYVVASKFLIFIPVLVNIYIVRGITTSEILFIEAIYCMAILLFEIPTGYIGDKIGHDKLVIIGLLGTVISYIIFAFASTLIIILFSQVLLGIFNTCMSGSDIASLSVGLEESNSMVVHKSLYVVSTTSLLIAYIASSFAIKYNPNGILIFLIMAFVNLCALVFFILFIWEKKKNKLFSSKTMQNPEIENKEKLVHINNTVSKVDLIACGVMLGIISAIYLVSQIFYNNVGLDAQILGGIYCVNSVLIIIFTKTKFKFNKKTFFILPLLFVFPIFSHKYMVVPFVILLSWAKAKVFPFVNNFVMLNSENNKALNLSISNVIDNGINAILMLTLSGIVSRFGFASAMILFTALSTVVIWVIYQMCSGKLKKTLELSKL